MPEETEKRKDITCEECESVHYANGELKKKSDKRKGELKKLEDFDRLKDENNSLKEQLAASREEVEKLNKKLKEKPPEHKEEKKEEKSFFLKKEQNSGP
jgi:hypothetical protein